MAEELPKPEDIRERAASGIPITRQEISDITKAEQTVPGQTVKGGSAATAQSLYAKQQDFYNQATEVLSRPAEEITKEEADQMQAAEVRTPKPPF